MEERNLSIANANPFVCLVDKANADWWISEPPRGGQSSPGKDFIPPPSIALGKHLIVVSGMAKGRLQNRLEKLLPYNQTWYFYITKIVFYVCTFSKLLPPPLIFFLNIMCSFLCRHCCSGQ
jgi:hypothetical protein